MNKEEFINELNILVKNNEENVNSIININKKLRYYHPNFY